ncbi:MAG TPA: sigma-54 dependent transcriptional regulator [Bryobacteraceae bacterium]
MVQVALYTPDVKLQHLLAPALGSGFKLVPHSDRDACQQLLFEGETDVLLLDLESEPSTVEKQVKFFEEIRPAGIPTIILTDDGSRQSAVDLVTGGAFGYCRKPPALRELKALITRAHEHGAMKRELKSLGRSGAPRAEGPAERKETLRCDGLIGGGATMCKVYDMIRRVASLNASVLITGESGTGKELVARAIHNLGSRAQAPFVAVSAGAIPESLIEAELFGHEKGAFTGTVGVRVGYFEQVGNGTILIDEVGELPLQIQVKLLRVLQQREFTRLGSGRPIPLRARVLFATNRNLSAMVEDGTFRLDLFYRINVMNIKLPSLVDHAEDIPALADFFLSRYGDQFQKTMAGIAPDAVSLLEAYDWPGNVRELENVIQCAIIRADGDVIQAADLPEQFQQTRRGVADALSDIELTQAGSFERMLREFKFKIAIKAIQDCNGNKTLAARSLAISRAYLHRLIRSQEDSDISDVA